MYLYNIMCEFKYNPAMKVKIVFILLSISSLLLLPGSGHAQKAALQAEQFSVRLAGDSVHVSFVLHAQHLGSDYRMDLVPVVYNGAHCVSLPCVRLAGKRNLRLQRRERLFPYRRLFSGKRKTTAQQEDLADTNIFPVSPAVDSLLYTVALPYREWMSVLSLRVDGTLTGCCSSQTMPSLQVAAGIPLCGPQEEIPMIVEIPALPALQKEEKASLILSPARELALHETFLRPAEDYFADKRAGLYHRDKAGLRIYFRRGRHDIDTAYMDNGATLRRLKHALNVVRADSSVRLSALLVAGYTSIEGSVALNNRLAGARANALKAFAVSLGIAPTEVETLNMGEDWDTLRDLASQSDSLPFRQEVLRIIDTVPVLKGREKRLMDLRGGVPYRWMMKHLFPLQRNAGYIRLYYTDANQRPCTHAPDD